MPKIRSPKRAYNSARRQEGARLTRQAIAEAALQLFCERGYGGASIDAIAEVAKVAPETIYATFGNKRNILHYLINVSVGGDEDRVRVIDRREQQAVLQELDARRLVAGFSEGVAKILERAAPVFGILAEAAKIEPELAALQNQLQSERRENMRRVAKTIGGLAPLRVNESQAADILWALTSPELFSLMTGARPWTTKKYSAWLHESLARLLFRDEPNKQRVPLRGAHVRKGGPESAAL